MLVYTIVGMISMVAVPVGIVMIGEWFLDGFR